MKNSIKYKGNTNNTSVITFFKIETQKLPAMALCLGEPPRRFLLLLFFISFLHRHFIFDIHFVDVLHLSLFFIHLYFDIIPRPSVNHRRIFTPILYFQPAHRRVIHDTFISNLSAIFWPRALRFWMGVFYPQAFFTLRSFADIFDSTCVYQGFPGSRQFFLEVCRASYWSSKHRPGPSVCLIHSNPQSSYSEDFIFKFYHILSWITCGKKFSLYAPYSFRTLFACSKSYVKTIKKHFEQD